MAERPTQKELSTPGQRSSVRLDLYCLVLRMQGMHLERRRPGGVAQLGEHLLCKQGVRSSILLISTKDGRIAQVVRAHA